ncbi:concanavalin A-like lectin/glucanases family protein [Leptospira ryugenii]|uniref:Concanavalin A-like lectin/glucanases family protein n=1 Tax=Leptospira ryugenii TaxID=1917863 RepID=A0A2P2DZQ9_9LEPT|nr:concanavalin A-like lectin/glucanases family protein [Leptospira ryugenii]
MSGLISNSSVTLSSGNDTLVVNKDGNFTFPNLLRSGTQYEVKLTLSSSSALKCNLSNEKGTVQSSNITDVKVECGLADGYYQVGVSITGTGGPVTFQNNATDTITIVSDTLSKFNTPLKTGDSYLVTISSQTAGTVCAFLEPSSSQGIVGTTNITVTVRCVPGYLTGGTIIPLATVDLFPNVDTPNLFLRTMVGDYPANAGGTGPTFGNANNTSANLVRFNNPKGMAGDGTYIYVADYDNDLIRRINRTTGETTSFAGGASVAGGTTCPGTVTTNCLDGTGLAAQFYRPFALTTDGTSLYVLELLGNRIRRINLTTAQVTTLAGDGSSGFSDNTNGLLASFLNPHSITMHQGMLYVVDRYNHRIRSVNPVTGAVSTFAGTGVAGYLDANASAAIFNNPVGIVGLGNFLYISDLGNHRIRRISLLGANPVTTIAGQSTPGSKDDVGTKAFLDAPFSLATDGTNLIFSEYTTYLIRHVRLSDTKVSTLVGGIIGYSDNAGLNAAMQRPAYLLSDGYNMYISEENNHAIRRIENAEILRYTFDGNSNDSVSNNHGLLNGGPNLVADENGTASAAYEFDGSTQNIRATSNVTYNGQSLGMGNNKKFTISAWIFPRGGSTDQVIFSNGTQATDGFTLILQGTTRLLYLYVNSVPSGIGIRPIPLNQWTHVTVTNNADNWQIYVNGLSENIIFNAATNAPTSVFQIAGGAGALSFFSGKVSDVRIFNGTLDTNAIQKLAIQVPTGLIAYFPFNGNTNDVSGNGNDLTIMGTPSLATDRNGLPNSAYIFNSNLDYMEKANPNRVPTGNNNRTTCVWVRSTSSPVNLVSFGAAVNGQGNGLALGNSSILHYGYVTDQTTDHFYLLGRWVHICGTYDGANSQIYFNGSLRSTTGITWATAASATLRVGRRMDAGEFFSGSLDDIRIYNRVLSASEIQALSGPHPLQVAGLQMHLQADSITASPVTAWFDNSPNNTTATSTGGNSVSQPLAGQRPTWSAIAINNTPGVIFNSASSHNLRNISGTYFGLNTDSFTMFVVNYRNSLLGAQTVLSTGPIPGGKSFLFDDAGAFPCSATSRFSVIKLAAACAAISDVGFSPMTQRIFTMSYDHITAITNPFYWDVNGPVGATITSNLNFIPPSGVDGIFVGSRIGPNDHFDGILSEIIYFNSALSTSDADLVRCYLSRKYKIRIGNLCPY